MWASGVVDLGLASEYFWSLTPDEFHWLFEKHLERENRADRRAALVACFVGNFAGKSLAEGASPLSIDDVLGAKRTPIDELARFRDQAENALEKYVDRLRKADPRAEIEVAKAILDAAAHGVGTWGKLGAENKPMQPVSIARAMNPGWRPN